MNDIYDLLVIGGGPAGATLARLAGEGGLRVLVIDGALPGRPKLCGGLISPDARKTLEKMDLSLPEELFCTPQLCAVRTIDLGNGCVREYGREYVSVRRDAFDAWLLALANWAETVHGRAATLRREGKLWRVSVRENGVLREYRAKKIAGADGADSMVRRCIAPERRGGRLVAIQQRFAWDRRAAPFYSCVFDRMEGQDVCGWSLVKDGELLFGGAFPARGSRGMFEGMKARLRSRFGFPFGEILGTDACGLRCALRPSDILWGAEDAFLVGEAAGLVSPSSYEGISYALQSAEALASSLCGGMAYPAALLPLRMKLLAKSAKRALLFNPVCRSAIMHTGIGALRGTDCPGEIVDVS